MTNEIMVAKDNRPVVHGEVYPTNPNSIQYYPLNKVKAGKYVDEVISAEKTTA